MFIGNKELDNVPNGDAIGSFSLFGQLRKVFNFYKASSDQAQLYSRGIQIIEEGFQDFYLLPISKLHLDDTSLVNTLKEWRTEFIHIYPNSSIPTTESTQMWLDSGVVNNKERILFLVVDKFGKRHGHLGFWMRDNDVIELDNVLKCPDSGIPGLFTASVRTVCLWINEVLNLEEVSLRVLNSNKHAVSFYENIGFRATEFQNNQLHLSKAIINSSVLKNEPVQDDWLLMSLKLEYLTDVPQIISTAGPSITAFEVSFTSDAVKSGWNTHHSDYLSRFSREFGSYVGAEYVIPTDSCTSALHLGLWALGVGPGDEVIVPDLTWVATANAVKYVGATPIFADIDKKTWCLDPSSVRSLVSPRTKAIIPVHLYGYVADLTELDLICREFNLSLLQDAAPGIGSMFLGKGVAQYGDFSAFSFQGAKLLVSGEGGVLTTNNKSLYEKAFKIADVGRRPGTFWIETYGKKMKMSNLTASLALGQMQSVERQIEKKRKINNWYRDLLSELPDLKFQEEDERSRSINWMTSINLENYNNSRDDFAKELLKKGIDTRPVFPAISQYPIWDREITPQNNAQSIGSNSLNLPSGVKLSKKTIEFICAVIRDTLRP